MRLKRLELCGFKSFADRTAFDFERVLTGIVGPNGCGKSNVVDSIRWVLGEQRARSMRSGEMADVIFKGSVSRPALSAAEATLVLDNGAGVLDGQGTEVAITRRIDADGQGEYLINGDRARLKDIRDLLFDTGLGSRGYAVLEQGRIDAVLSANAQERRSIFEEAAGISRYRQRRRETELRLKRIEQDGTRLDDILRELATRVRSLKIQATKAEKYVAVRDDWRRERGRFLRHKVWSCGAELARLREELGGVEERARSLRESRERGEEAVQTLEESQRRLSGRVEERAGEVSRLAGEARALDERKSQLGQRIEAWRASSLEEEQRADQLEVLSGERRDELLLTRERAGHRSAEAEAAREQLGERSSALRQLRAEYRELRSRSEEQNETVLELLHRKTAGANSVRHHEESREPLSLRLERIDQRLDEARSAAQEARRAEEEARTARGAAEEDLQRAEADREESTATLRAQEERIEALEAELARLGLERARHTERILTLRDWEREHEGLEAGARAVLDGVGEADGPCHASELEGVLADHLRTSPRLARALDAVLAERALGLVVDDPQVAVEVVAWLRDRRAGLAGLLVPGSLSRRERSAPAACGEMLDPRVEGWLLDRVEYEEAFAPLAHELFGDVVVVRDLAAALDVIREYPSLRCVTPAGDLADAAGVLGGHRELAQGAVGRRSSAEQLEGRVRELEAEIASETASLERLGRGRLERMEQRRAAGTRLEAARDRLSEAWSAERTARARTLDQAESLALLERDAEAVRGESARLDEELERARTELASAEDRFRVENESLGELESERHRMEAERDQLVREEAEARVEATRAAEQMEALQQRARDLETACEETGRELERARRLAGEAAESALGGERELLQIDELRGRVAEDLGQREAALVELRRSDHEGREAIESQRRGLETVTRELEEVAEEISRRRLEEQRLAMVRAELLQRAEEDLGLPEAELLEDFEPEPELTGAPELEELEREVAELRGRLDRLGSVNTEAVDELEGTRTRFEFLGGQRRDVETARRSLQETLERIDAESEQLFLETFDTVRDNFQVLFRQLFGGGRADLTLEPDVDALSAGILITARPPGREMLSIDLLSGGQRTLTALALLFAVFQARPSPFCVLDEVDAALDDANIGRFLGMLDGFLQSTQFIIVTHNKGTMSACSALFGVTMETKGVSRQVAVEFGEVDDFVPEATGDAARARASREGVRVLDEVDEHGERVVELRPRGGNGSSRGKRVGAARPDPDRPPTALSGGEGEAERKTAGSALDRSEPGA